MAEAGKGDELAQTATAPGSAPSGAAQPIGDSLGRYKLERMLGEGGMGVVHCAFDPDLERRVALKVLRRSDGADDARQRLLREARAMARLTHPNVVAVHEVGTAGDRDFVAMELIDGETLADWLKSAKRSPREITHAFIAAGRGLAAAHNAGLVHRDFKPHNVLRARNGRVVVTDFGLARGVEAAISFEATMKPSQLADATPSSLSGITATGSVLGTPAYMAPEQWDGGIVGPAADQFAFCVALWEALTGERPFKGQTLDELKRDVQRGVEALDVSRVPRRLRAPLRRGLQRDPAKRYPNMDALLAALERADRSASLWSIAWRGAAVLATLAFLIVHERGKAAPSCEPPAAELGSVWSPAIAQVTPSALAPPFDKLASRWSLARATACTADPMTRPTQLRCLDGVLARFSAVRQGFSRVAGVDGEDAMAELVDPTVCLTPAPPRLGLAATPDAAKAFELLAVASAAAHKDDDAPKPPPAQAQAFVDRTDVEPCARVIGLRALGETSLDFQARRNAINEAVQSGEQCEDDRVRAETLIESMPYQFELPVIGPRGQQAIKRAAAAVARVSQVDLRAHVELARAMVEAQQEHWADALGVVHRLTESLDAEGFHDSAVKFALEEIDWNLARSRQENYAAARTLVAKWLPVARAIHDDKHAHELEQEDAYARYAADVGNADTAAARAAIVRLWRQAPHLQGPHIRVEGDVVDTHGKPVANAVVAASSRLNADSAGVLPIVNLHRGDFGLREVTTDAGGHFAIEEAPIYGAIIAQLGELRSTPQRIAAKVKLVVGPTRTISGTVPLGGMTNTEPSVIAMTEIGDAYMVMAPVRADSTFELAGAPTTKFGIALAIDGIASTSMRATPIAAGTEPIKNLVLKPSTSGRTLDVLVRSTVSAPINTAQIVILPGHEHITNVAQLDKSLNAGMSVAFARHVAGEGVPRPALDQYKPGDLWARFTNVDAGDVTVCSLALVDDLMDTEAMHKLQAHFDEIEASCKTIGGDVQVIVVPTAPMKRMD
ncbi:MAG TPA: serine/threonine-protein kinase [Kofleriaceae bacterium]|nr:serine/threonine-protein kinase [Kofleriaceae bacterium]